MYHIYKSFDLLIRIYVYLQYRGMISSCVYYVIPLKYIEVLCYCFMISLYDHAQTHHTTTQYDSIHFYTVLWSGLFCLFCKSTMNSWLSLRLAARIWMTWTFCLMISMTDQTFGSVASLSEARLKSAFLVGHRRAHICWRKTCHQSSDMSSPVGKVWSCRIEDQHIQSPEPWKRQTFEQSKQFWSRLWIPEIAIDLDKQIST